MGFEFVQVVGELGEGVTLRRKLVGGEDGFMGLAGTPAPELSAMMEQDFHEAKHAGVVDVDTGDFAAPGGRSTWWP